MTQVVQVRKIKICEIKTFAFVFTISIHKNDLTMQFD